jgi:hypothetical protein
VGTLLWTINFSEYVVRVRADVVELGCVCLLSRVEYDAMAFIVV